MCVQLLTHADVDVFTVLCRPGAVILFIYRELDGSGKEHEVGFVTSEDVDYYEVKWQCIGSTSGCDGLKFKDRYARSRREYSNFSAQSQYALLTQRAGKIFDSIEENHDLVWSSVPIER